MDSHEKYTRTFWQLGPAEGSALVDWTDKVKLEQVTCPRFPSHRRSGRRLTQLSVSLPDVVRDFVWTAIGDCLIQTHVFESLRSHGVTGFTLRSVEARFANPSSGSPPEFWELVVTGWGGVAPVESGVVLDPSKSCPTCGHLVYSSLIDPSRLIDRALWDGSDFFLVWPLPRFYFVTDRVAQIIRSEEFTGISLTELSEIRTDTMSLSPGRLSYWFPKEAADRIGGPLGIA